MRTKVHRRLRERRETERREPKRTQHEPHAARAKARGFITREYQGTMQHREKWPLGSSKAVARGRPNRIEPKREAGGVDNGCTLPWKVNN